MTKKDFELIVDVLIVTRPAVGEGESDIWHEVVDRFAEKLASNNPKFNSARFIAACKAEGK